MHTKRNLLYILSLAILLGTGLSACQSEKSPALDSNSSKSAAKLDSMLLEVRNLIFSDVPHALNLAYEGLEVSVEEGLQPQQLQFLGEIGSLFQEEGDYQQAHIHYDQAIDLAQNRKDSIQWIQWLGEKGYSYLYEGQDSGAMKAFTNALLLAQQVKNVSEDERQRFLIPATIDMAQLFATILDYSQADIYLSECQELLREFPDSTYQARLYEAEAFRFLSQGMSEDDIPSIQTAIAQYRKSNHLYLALNATDFIPPNYLNLVHAFVNWAELDESRKNALTDSAKSILNEFLTYSDKHQLSPYYLSGQDALAGLYIQQEQYAEAKETLRNILIEAGKIGSGIDSALSLISLSEIHELTGQFDSAVFYLHQYDEIASHIRDDKSVKAMRVAEARFRTEKKELENKQIRTDSRRRLQQTITIAAFLALILLSASVYYYQRQRLQKTKLVQQGEMNRQIIIDLIKEQSIETLNARLEGQEKERTRVARELHDHLGGTLAATKISLAGLKRKLPSSAMEDYESTMDMVKTAYQETRQLSHDMMAFPLKDLGLEASFRALCSTINNSGKLHVDFDLHEGQALFIGTEKELHLYRILQELLQNVIKHARATAVTVQLTHAEGQATLLVEDNGRGFPKKSLQEGLGLSNIRHRVERLSGTLDIDSRPGGGSTIIVQFPSLP